ncbi:S-adenosylmethionine:tRNA ribosyltransferase-isomerase [Phytohabitans suffuscus]|uniref:S-adenosylmethionine:tRNA ribosyltransferase-isomerase n=1 Tax=Phytohabitans suffuscus TaxID=624315 RepID=A0A6F8YLR7_9ACTN|nr:S-adenosylmethionine:tRNA ribosyltransferase-isomerase [Phytohabitans suffuscus]BCB86891.1 S-adenosylmethionine:tRNA ribosyltransferase-isomerase [Phytohabitans suffuscus]
MSVSTFVLPAELEAHEPPEARGLARDGVRLLAGEVSTGATAHRRFTDLPRLLRAGDVLVVNTSGTLPAAVPVVGAELTVHFSTELDRGEWLVELRQAAGKATRPYHGGVAGQRYPLPGGGSVRLREEYSRGRLWTATVDAGGPVLGYLGAYGQPIRYSYVPRPWPLRYYQTVFATEPGSAEMPSAARPFSERVVTRLVAAGVLLAPVLLHTGVASPEAHERPYPERFVVPETTARLVTQAKAGGGRVIAVGTTVVRALETAATGTGAVAAASGWTELVVTPERGVRVVDGLLTGFHEPRASHLDLLETVAGRPLLDRMYAEAIGSRYLWHEFGDVNLILP